MEVSTSGPDEDCAGSTGVGLDSPAQPTTMVVDYLQGPSQPRCRQPSSRVPVSLGREFPLLQNGLLRQLAALLAAAGKSRPGGVVWPTSPVLDLATSRFSTLLSTPQPCLALAASHLGAIRTTHAHSSRQNVQARPQSSCGLGLCRAQGVSAPSSSPAPAACRALKPRCSGHMDTWTHGHMD